MLYSLKIKRGTVLMEPIKIQKIIDYIEAHLTEELSYKQFAAMVAVSEADLQRHGTRCSERIMISLFFF